MGRTVICSQKLEDYLIKYADQGRFCYGLIVGQPSSQKKDYVVHITRTLNDSICIKEPEEDDPSNHTKEEEINFEALVHHLISVTRMIVGSFFVLGVFVVDNEDIFAKKDRLDPLKYCLKQFNNALKEAKYTLEQTAQEHVNEDKLILFYSSETRVPVCKTYNEKSDTLSSAEWKFVKNPPEWFLFESSYEFDDVFPLIESNAGINLEKNFIDSLENMSTYIKNSEIFFQNEKLDQNMVLEMYLKDRKFKNDGKELLKATVFLPEVVSPTEPIKVEKYQGTIRLSGTIVSRIWSHPKNCFKDIEGYIRNDILRSLAARVQIYCDSLSNSTVNKDLVISEPPRRVFFDIPGSDGIQCSEYLFRNELPEVAAEQAKEILDLNIKPDNVIMNFEGLPELEDSISLSTETSFVDRKSVATEISKHMYILGIAVALIVLFFSVALHFIFR